MERIYKTTIPIEATILATDTATIGRPVERERLRTRGHLLFGIRQKAYRRDLAPTQINQYEQATRAFADRRAEEYKARLATSPAAKIDAALAHMQERALAIQAAAEEAAWLDRGHINIALRELHLERIGLRDTQENLRLQLDNAIIDQLLQGQTINESEAAQLVTPQREEVVLVQNHSWVIREAALAFGIAENTQELLNELHDVAKQHPTSMGELRKPTNIPGVTASLWANMKYDRGYDVRLQFDQPVFAAMATAPLLLPYTRP